MARSCGSRKRFLLCPEQNAKSLCHARLFSELLCLRQTRFEQICASMEPLCGPCAGVSARLRMPNKPLESASRGMLKRLAAAHIPQPCCTKAPMGTCALSLGALRHRSRRRAFIAQRSPPPLPGCSFEMYRSFAYAALHREEAAQSSARSHPPCVRPAAHRPEAAFQGSAHRI